MSAPERIPDGPGTSSPASGASASAGGGRPLPAEARSFFGSRFGHDFSRVRIHTDVHAARVAAAHQARALTVGHDITFARGEYEPTTWAGRHLLAHELAHVLQQGDRSHPQRQAVEGVEASGSELRAEDGVEIDQAFGAAEPVGGISPLHGPPVVQRVCARPSADVGYPVRVDLGIPATPPPDRSRTTAQISAMAGDASGRTAGLTRFRADLRWDRRVEWREGRSWVTDVRVHFSAPSIRVFLTREQAEGSCESRDLERHERRHDDDFRANAAEAERAICDTAGTWPRRSTPTSITGVQLVGLIDDWMAFERWRLEYDNWLDGCTWDTVDYPRMYASCPNTTAAGAEADCGDHPPRPEPQHVVPHPDKQ
ncbi:eCIS core domain-containing protein [Geodermatophilus amargosae]|uniref:eCIS core domain-containing protein n=1 Tax=Geodermatophilus amargosae TaxID=1296565 RepID=UPI0034DE17EF